jgi:hypothetical protein
MIESYREDLDLELGILSKCKVIYLSRLGHMDLDLVLIFRGWLLLVERTPAPSSV